MHKDTYPIHIYTQTLVHTHTHTHEYTYAHTYTHTHTNTHTHTHTYTHIRTHTHTHTHTQTNKESHNFQCLQEQALSFPRRTSTRSSGSLVLSKEPAADYFARPSVTVIVSLLLCACVCFTLVNVAVRMFQSHKRMNNFVNIHTHTHQNELEMEKEMALGMEGLIRCWVTDEVLIFWRDTRVPSHYFHAQPTSTGGRGQEWTEHGYNQELHGKTSF
jgi:hypothetical protein